MVQGCVILSNELKMSVYGRNESKYGRRTTGKNLHSDYIIATIKHPVTVIIKCSLISKDVTRICLNYENINSRNYFSETHMP